MQKQTDPQRSLRYFFLVTWAIVVAVTYETINLDSATAHGFRTTAFLIAAWLSYCFIYLLPALGLTKAAHWLAHRNSSPAKQRLVDAVAITTTALTTLFFYANAKLFALYGIFVNGFVVNLIVTPGGIQSLGGSDASTLGFVMIAAGFFLCQALLLLLVRYIDTKIWPRRIMPTHFFRSLIILFAILALGERATYAYCNAVTETSVLTLAEDIPFYQPFTTRNFFRKIGVKVKKQDKLEAVQGRLRYPLNPLQVSKLDRPYNIIWLASESWRADMLDPEIMPQTWAFAQRAQRYTRNYSGGNGTRVGVFTMFTGIPGTYWFSFLDEHRGSAIIDVLKQQNYQMNFYTSAAFSYPEFDKTIFRDVPPDRLHQFALEDPTPGWRRDQINVGQLLESIDQRDKSRPFFTFMFFESPHARYYFPPESVIRSPYRDDINYATLDKDTLAKDIGPIKNRYINAVHHLDSQFGRIFDYLDKHGLLEDTIVVLLGDHGEEFMEHGYWGHNSTFVDQQVRTPLVIWKPGSKPAVHDFMTSHMDVVPTLMPLLGVANPRHDYSTGFDLLSREHRQFTYLGDWSRVAYVDDEVKIVMPVKFKGVMQNRISTVDDQPVEGARKSEFFAAKQSQLVRMMQDLGQFMDNKRKKQP